LAISTSFCGLSGFLLPALIVPDRARAQPEITRTEPEGTQLCPADKTIVIVRCASGTLISCDAPGQPKPYACIEGYPQRSTPGGEPIAVPKAHVVERPHVIVVGRHGLRRHHKRWNLIDFLFHHHGDSRTSHAQKD
jgi:hypothetical protein